MNAPTKSPKAGTITIAPPTPNRPDTTPPTRPMKATSTHVILCLRVRVCPPPPPPSHHRPASPDATRRRGERHADFRAEWRAVQAGGPARPVASTGGAARGMTASLGEDARLHRGERHELADHALPPRPPPRPAPAPSPGVRLNAQRKLHPQDLDRRLPGVRHS